MKLQPDSQTEGASQFPTGMFKEKMMGSINFGRNVNAKDYKVMTSKLICRSEIKVATLVPFQLKMKFACHMNMNGVNSTSDFVVNTLFKWKS